MAKSRSPNYPALGLGKAIEAITEIHKRDMRNRMSRDTVSHHLNYKSVNGRALGKIAALRSFGLLEGAGNELRVTHQAVSIIAEPVNSEERQAAVRRAAFRPPLFKDLNEHFEGNRPSEENLRSELLKRDFTHRAVGKVVKTFLETLDLVSQEGGGYNDLRTQTELEDELEPATDPGPGVTENKILRSQTLKEREILRSPLSDKSSVRLLVSGPMTAREFKKLRQLIYMHELWQSLDSDEKNEVMENFERQMDEASEPQ